MSTFADIIAATRSAGGDLPGTFFDDITASYDSDMSGANSQVALLNEEIEALKARVLEVEAHNYRLIQAGAVEPGGTVPDGDHADEPGDGDGGGEDEPGDDEDVLTPEELFN